jgi:YD repeat-containing protein
LTSIFAGGATTTYGYDAFGNRILQTGTSTTYIYPSKWYSVAFLTGTGAKYSTSSEYVFNGDTLIATVDRQLAAGVATGTAGGPAISNSVAEGVFFGAEILPPVFGGRILARFARGSRLRRAPQRRDSRAHLPNKRPPSALALDDGMPAPTDGPTGGVAATLDEAKAAFRAAWDAHG